MTFHIGIASRDHSINPSNVYGFLDDACRRRHIVNLSVNFDNEPSFKDVNVDGSIYPFIEVAVDNEEIVVKEIINGFIDAGIPAYYGDVYYKIPFMQTMFKKAVVLHSPVNGKPGNGVVIVKSIIDEQCGMEFPTKNFGNEIGVIMYYPLDIPVPIDYNTFTRKADLIMRDIIIESEYNRILSGHMERIAKATKIYPPQMIWREEIPRPIQKMMDKITVYEVNVLPYITMEDARWLGIEDYVLQLQNNSVASTQQLPNIGDVFGQLLSPDDETDLMDGISSLLVSLGQSKFRGRQFRVSKIGANRLMIEMGPEQNQNIPVRIGNENSSRPPRARPANQPVRITPQRRSRSPVVRFTDDGNMDDDDMDF